MAGRRILLLCAGALFLGLLLFPAWKGGVRAADISQRLGAIYTLILRTNHAPDGRIVTPAADVIISAGESVYFSGSGTDSDGDTPLQYQWDFGDQNIAGSTLQTPGAVRFDTNGSYSVTLTVVDSRGKPDPDPALVHVQVGPRFSQIVDDRDAAFAATGQWNEDTSAGCDQYADSSRFGLAASESAAYSIADTVTWTLTVPYYGLYRLGGWWPGNSSCYSEGTGWVSWEADHKILNNGVVVDALLVNQGKNTGQFNTLGEYWLAPGSLEVQLPRAAARAVRADAMQLQLLEQGDRRVEIITPADNDLFSSSTVTVKALKYELPTGWSIRFALDGGTTAIVGTSCGSGGGYVCAELSGLSRSEHTLEARAVDSSGALQPYTDTVHFGVGDYYVLIGDSITAGYGDDDSSDDVSADGRNRNGGWIPPAYSLATGGYGQILNDLLTSAFGFPHTMINEGVGGDTSKEGAERLPSILARHPRATHFLVFFGTNDSSSWATAAGRRPSGLGLRSGDTGYAGSFKAYMQEIIDLIQSAGHQVVLAYCPVALGEDVTTTPFADPDSAEKNQYIKEYNQVVDELRAENGISLTAPDLYTQFLNNKDSWFSDNLHPNGSGYQGIAWLWSQALGAR